MIVNVTQASQKSQRQEAASDSQKTTARISATQRRERGKGSGREGGREGEDSHFLNEHLVDFEGAVVLCVTLPVYHIHPRGFIEIIPAVQIWVSVRAWGVTHFTLGPKVVEIFVEEFSVLFVDRLSKCDGHREIQRRLR